MTTICKDLHFHLRSSSSSAVRCIFPLSFCSFVLLPLLLFCFPRLERHRAGLLLPGSAGGLGRAVPRLLGTALPSGPMGAARTPPTGGVRFADLPEWDGSGTVASIASDDPPVNRSSVPGTKATDECTIKASFGRNAPATCTRSGPDGPSTRHL